MKIVALSLGLADATNKDLEIPETCSFFHPNFCYAKTSLNPDVIRNFFVTLLHNFLDVVLLSHAKLKQSLSRKQGINPKILTLASSFKPIEKQTRKLLRNCPITRFKRFVSLSQIFQTIKWALSLEKIKNILLF